MMIKMRLKKKNIRDNPLHSLQKNIPNNSYTINIYFDHWTKPY